VNNKLLILDKNAQQYSELLQEQNFSNLNISAFDDAKTAAQHCSECSIIFGAPDLVQHILPFAARVQWVQSTWAGVTPLLESNLRKDYILTGVKGIFGRLMSEYVFCYMLMQERKVFQRYRLQQKYRWDQTLTGTLRGKALGVMGVGSIGARIAKTAHFFEMQTFGFTFRSSDCEYIDVYFHAEQLMDLASRLDYLVCTLPNTSSTQNLIDSKLLAAMKRSALLINVGRGSVIDETALVEALHTGTIAGAVLDVFREEPLPEGHPLWKTPNTIITSHTAAPTFPEDILPIFVENYRRFVKGEPLQNIVNFEKGY